MKIFGLSITHERSLPGGEITGTPVGVAAQKEPESSPQGSAQANANVRLPSVPAQPINVNTSEKSMQLAAVYRCVSILSGTIASLPLHIERKQGGYYSVDEQNELHKLLTRRPNKRQNAYDMILNAVIQIVQSGNAYIFIRRTWGEVRELVLCAPNTVCYDKFRNVYKISDPINRISGVFEADDVIHLKNKSLDGGYTGVSTIYYASRVLSIGGSADNQSLRTFQNGSKIKGIVSGVKGDTRGLGAMTDGQTADVAERLEDELNSGRDIVAVSGDASFSQLSITPVDAQLLEQMKHSVLEICRFYGVNPDKAFAGQATNYKASEMGQVSFLTDTLLPMLRQIEAELNVKLIPDSVSHLYRIRFDLDALYQTDLTTQMAYWKGGHELGMFTTNYLRAQKGLPPVEGGDVVMTSCNVAPIDSPKLRGDKTEQPKAEEKT